MPRSVNYALFFLLGGSLLATHLSHELMPLRQPLTPVTMADGWITTAQPSHRGYFRQTLEIPFRPKHAWLSIAAEDYRLYVNGVAIASNTYLVNTGTPFQNKLSTQAQSLTQGDVFPTIGRSAVAKASNQEWRAVQFHDLLPHLKQGLNTLAVYVQSERLNRLAVKGRVSGEGVQVEISGDPSAWRSSNEAISASGVEWHRLQGEDLEWQPARAAQPPEDLPLYVVADPDIWMERFEASVLTSYAPGEEHIFRTALPQQSSQRRGWLRIWSSWPYDLFVGEQWIGLGGGMDQIEAFDISLLLAQAPEQLAIRMHRGAGTLRAGKEAPWLAVDGRIGAITVSTESGWSYLASFHPAWLKGAGEWPKAQALDRTIELGPIRYQLSQGRTWNWLLDWIGVAILLTLLLAAAAWAVSRLKPHATAVQSAGAGFGPPSLAWACWLLAPALLTIALIEALRFRFAQSDALLTFLDPAKGRLLLAAGPLLLVTSLLWLTRPVRQRARALGAFCERIERLPTGLWLALICLLSLALRVYGLEFQPPNADDYTSWDAARGILQSGVPQATSGIFYTRSPLFHYLLAGWLGLFGDSLASARSFSLVPGTGLILVAYSLVAAITRRRLPALLTALVLALDPWLLANTNLIRFYQLMQFFALASVLFFLKGFIWREGKRYQTLFFVCATAGVLSQEIFAATFAVFLAAFLFCYRPFDWQQDRNVWVGFAAMMLVCWLDLRTFAILSMTPHVALSSRSESLFVPHLVDLLGGTTTGTTTVATQLATAFFWMNNGENAFWSMLFFAGLIYWSWRADRAMLTLYGVVLLTVAALSVLVVAVNSRYAYGVYPVFVAAAIISADAMIRRFAQGSASLAPFLSPALVRRWVTLVAAVFAVGWVVNSEFDKRARSYSTYWERDYRSAWEYIAAHRQPGDKMASVVTPGAAVVFGGVDYYAMWAPAFDTLYQRSHGIVDRWSGGKLLWKVDQFRDVFLRHARVWVIVDDLRWPAMNPGVTAFLTDCCSVQSEFFGGQVRLWDRSAGRFSTAADQGGGADSY